MPYKPHEDAERRRIEKLIVGWEKEVASQRASIASLRQQLEQGQWYSGRDWSSFPKPEPACYICAFRAPALDKCKKSHEYGIVCNEYKHFSEV